MPTAKKVEDARNKGLMDDAETLDLLEGSFITAAFVANLAWVRGNVEAAHDLLTILNLTDIPRASKGLFRSIYTQGHSAKHTRDMLRKV